ncbi:ribonuclease-like 3 [Onychostoma macrolepis]|uniref:ribonuclease-like 3 n=1 Tax=Onychostoma macrolepis TaxID=369639 RepID=UPI00272CA82C|nr:ribonuclease-like 3 [Onychostoma macrolepis]
MEIHRSTVILLLLLSVSSFTHGQPADVMRRYQKFLTQHQGPYVNVEMCTDEISDRNIGSETGECKPVNTFIQAQDHQIKAVCSGGTRLYNDRNLFESATPYSVVTCRLKSGQWPNCEYYRGRLSTRYIVLACDQGWPVHYQSM